MGFPRREYWSGLSLIKNSTSGFSPLLKWWQWGWKIQTSNHVLVEVASPHPEAHYRSPYKNKRYSITQETLKNVGVPCQESRSETKYQNKRCSWCSVQFSSVTQSFLTLWPPWTAVHQASLSITNSWSLPKLMSIESVIPSNHLILYRPLLLLPSIFLNIKGFSFLFSFN